MPPSPVNSSTRTTVCASTICRPHEQLCSAVSLFPCALVALFNGPDTLRIRYRNLVRQTDVVYKDIKNLPYIISTALYPRVTNHLYRPIDMHGNVSGCHLLCKPRCQVLTDLLTALLTVHCSPSRSGDVSQYSIASSPSRIPSYRSSSFGASGTFTP